MREGEWKESKRGNTVQCLHFHICKYVTFYESERESKGGKIRDGKIQCTYESKSSILMGQPNLKT